MKSLVKGLHDTGIATTLISGDRSSLADSLSVDFRYSSMKPEDELEFLKSSQKNSRLVMVGNSFNSIAGLVQADVSIVKVSCSSAIAIVSFILLIIKADIELL